MVSSKVVSKKTEFIRHISALNGSFFEWFQEQYDKDHYADLSDGVQDYIDYVHQLQDRYLKEYGEVLTFGSGGNCTVSCEPRNMYIAASILINKLLILLQIVDS